MINNYAAVAFVVIMTGAMPSLAEEKIIPSSTLTDQPAPTPAAAIPPATPSHAIPEVKPQTEIKPERAAEELKEKPRAKASEKDIYKYKIKVGSLIATQARKLGSIGNGYATASFHIDENGDIGSISIKSSSSPKHAEAARRMLSGVHAGPPPGGSISLNQKFQFN